MQTINLKIVIGSTRPGRISGRVAKWVESEARAAEGARAAVIDLADFNMPFMNEPISPRYNPSRELDPQVARWLAELSKGDAYVFVTPEYNHSVPGVLKNALDFVTSELSRKPATVVAHGTVGGARATMHLKEILSESGAAVLPKAVALPGAAQVIDEQGRLAAAEAAKPYGPKTALSATLDELLWYGRALKTARNDQDQN